VSASDVEPVSNASSSHAASGDSMLGNNVAIIRRAAGLTGKGRPWGHKQQTDGMPRPKTNIASDETLADIATSSD
jgi:hypothetical protein